MSRHISVSELALDLIYKALDRNQETVERKAVAVRSEQELKSGRISSTTSLMSKISALAPNFGVKLV